MLIYQTDFKGAVSVYSSFYPSLKDCVYRNTILQTAGHQEVPGALLFFIGLLLVVQASTAGYPGPLTSLLLIAGLLLNV